MAKQATRLSDFQIPRSDDDTVAEPELAKEVVATLPVGSQQPVQDPLEALTRERLPEQAVLPVHIAPRPATEPRQAMTVRLPVSMHERIRTLMFTSRRSQQDIVEDALGAFLTANGT